MLSGMLIYTMAFVSQLAAVSVILDTDLGDDIDDTWALCMILGTPELDLKLITIASDDTETKTRLTAKILECTGHTDIPLGKGPKNSDRPLSQIEWLGDYSLEKYPGTIHEDGVQVLIDAVHASEEKITICVIGPHTNLAEALKRDPSIAEKARIVSMAGSVHIGYNGKEGRDPEWNVHRDVEAVKAVFAAPWEITIAPLDTCGTLILKGEDYAAVANSIHPFSQCTIANYEHWSNRKHYPEGESSILFDTLAVYLCHSDEAVGMETIKLRIDDAGNTVPDEENGRPVHCALTWKDKSAFTQHLIRTLLQK